MSRPLVVGGATVADRDVEQPVRPEAQLAAVVVELRVLDAQHLTSAGGIHRGTVRARVVDTPLGHHVVVVVRRKVALVDGGPRRAGLGLGLVGVEESGLLVVGAEGQSEQASLVVVDEEAAEIEPHCAQIGEQTRRRRLIIVVGRDRPDLASLLHHEQGMLLAGGGHGADRVDEPVSDALQVDGDVALRNQLGNGIGDPRSERYHRRGRDDGGNQGCNPNGDSEATKHVSSSAEGRGDLPSPEWTPR